MEFYKAIIGLKIISLLKLTLTNDEILINHLGLEDFIYKFGNIVISISVLFSRWELAVKEYLSLFAIKITMS